MRSYYKNFCRLLFCTALCMGMPFICLCQNTGWTLDAPANSVELISVGQGMQLGLLKFTFKNVSGKTIIMFQVSHLLSGLHRSQVGIDDFITGGRWGVEPGATTSLEVSSQVFSPGGQISKELRVDAIFYDDGSGFGPDKTQVEVEMLGAALEARREASLLSASPDPSISGLDNVAAQISSQSLDTAAEAVQSLRGITLPGISQTFINSQLAHKSLFIKIGANRARGEILTDISLLKSNDARWMAGSEAAQQLALERRPHALSDLGQKVSSWSEWQVQYLKKVFQEGSQ